MTAAEGREKAKRARAERARGCCTRATGFVLLVIVGITLVVFIYFAPTYVAFKRKHKDKLAILVFNIFFGWFAWIWALTGNVEGRYRGRSLSGCGPVCWALPVNLKTRWPF